MTATAILIVEDEKIIARGIEKQLTAMGYAVAGSASTGEEAIKKAVELRPDIVLMDIHLGTGMDGVEAASRIHKQVDVPVVYLTANSDNFTLHRARSSDPFGYVLKPYEDKELKTAIEIGLYRHKTEGRLRENEQWLTATLGSIGDGVIATDGKGRVRLMNALAEQLTGWRQAEALGRDVQDIYRIVAEESRLPVLNPVLHALKKGAPTTLKSGTLLIDSAGVERPIEDSAASILDAGGKASGVVLVFRDITERRRLERQLQEHRHKLEEANARLEMLATTDELTLLKNRRAFQVRLAEEIERSHRYKMPLSLMLLDVDHFKQFNDTFGHPAGDCALQGIARVLGKHSRSTDFVARYGGEEFAILLPNTDQCGAVVSAERIRKAIAEEEWPERQMTVSIGVATLTATTRSDTALVEEADAALYCSKRSGRNSVSHANKSNPSGD
jgi:diguanylate cyclase (GGDEF)-like protein/PAS domain S-box-containing protein